ncbi:FliM/FliN family flagellar motor C-terminal domain-containing protein [Aquabacterium sp.]|uniref:FliM/FliN family flagellar motor C-terminal domain-containing protein n=1 Tax=Aquabacterium sp. TaxID=1872578 RepID=UPI002D1BD001|nr:FliM/FliN family flagellar motor C-terminal domain-containing protein [Aquabacterium sp.]HSW06368.1 FliM/FliN family flagellar motor C-terminal domain-containing protein [Aquabacterium sp.]
MSSLRWIPESSLQAFNRAAGAAMRDWAIRWGMAGLQTAASSIAEPFTQATLQAPWRALQGDQGPWVRMGESIEADIAAALFGDTEAASDIARKAAAQAAADLADTLAALGRPQGPADKDADEPDRRLPGHWGLRYTCGLGRSQAEVVVNRAGLHALGWLKKPDTPALAARAVEAALARVPVQLRIELGHSEVTLKDLTALAVGDLVLAVEATTNSLRAVTMDGQPTLAGFLGRADGARALQLTTIKP